MAIATAALCEAHLIRYMIKYSRLRPPVNHRSLILFDVHHGSHIRFILLVLLGTYAVLFSGSLLCLATGSAEIAFLGELSIISAAGYFIGLTIFFAIMIITDSSTLVEGHESIFRIIRNKFGRKEEKGGTGGNGAEDLEKGTPLPPQHDNKEYATSIGSCSTLHNKEDEKYLGEEVKTQPQLAFFPKLSTRIDNSCDRAYPSKHALQAHQKNQGPVYSCSE